MRSRQTDYDDDDDGGGGGGRFDSCILAFTFPFQLCQAHLMLQRQQAIPFLEMKA